jgi:hypothetical protein
VAFESAAAEQAALRSEASVVVETATPVLTAFRVELTAHRLVRVSAHAPEAGYPTTPLVLEVRNADYPPPLAKKLLALAEAAAKGAAAAGAGGLGPVAVALRDFLAGNLFVPCWRELRQCAALCESRGGGMVGCNEGKGVAKFAVKTANYGLTFTATVPPDYPATGPTVAVKATDFPKKLVAAQVAQVREPR